MRALIHIGSPKAGSTSIQRCLLSSKKLLKQNSIRLLKQNKANGNKLAKESRLNFVSLFHASHSGPCPRAMRQTYANPEAYAALQRQQLQSLQQFLSDQSKRQRNLLISDEYLAGLLPEAINKAISILQESGYTEIRAVAYMREPASLYLSLLQQRLKADWRLIDPDAWYFPYAQISDNWAQQCPNGLTIRPFDRQTLTNGSVVADFAGIAEETFQLPKGSLADLDTGLTSNESLSPEAIDLLHNYQEAFHRQKPGRFTDDGRKLVGLLQESDILIGKKSPELHPWIRQRVIQRHQTDLSHLLEHYGVQFPHTTINPSDSNNQKPLTSTHQQAQPRQLTAQDLLTNLDPERRRQLELHCLHRLCTTSNGTGDKPCRKP